jgi:AraC family transcriptional regulator
MIIDFVTLQPIPVIMVRHTGPYDQIGGKFEELAAWVETNNVPTNRLIGLYYDNADYVPAEQLRSAACAEIPEGYQIVARGMPGHVAKIAGGNYATTRFVGSYEELGAAWSQFTNRIEGEFDKTIRDDPAFEVYVNDPSNASPRDLITDLYMPIH